MVKILNYNQKALLKNRAFFYGDGLGILE